MQVSYKIIGQNIRTSRRTARLTQEQAAGLLNMSPLHYGRLERGERRTSLDQLVQIADALSVPVDALVSGCLIEGDHKADMLLSGHVPSPEHIEYALMLLARYHDQLMAYYDTLKKGNTSSD